MFAVANRVYVCPQSNSTEYQAKANKHGRQLRIGPMAVAAIAVFNCICNPAPNNIALCQPVSSNLRRHRLRSAARGGLVVPATRTVRFSPRSFAVAEPSTWNALYQHHTATTNLLPCHFVASWRLNYTLEHITLTIARSRLFSLYEWANITLT